jgi:hypothetical protein
MAYVHREYCVNAKVRRYYTRNDVREWMMLSVRVPIFLHGPIVPNEVNVVTSVDDTTP